MLRYRSLAAGSVLSMVVGMALYGALFALPIFASTLMHYTAQDVGLMLLPGAIGSALMMPVAAVLMKRVDPRTLLFFGSLVLVTAVLWLGHLTPTTSSDDLFWPLLVRSFGSVLMFLPLSMAALGPIPKKDVGAATAIYNLTRQLGGSIGVALLATMLGARQAFHRSVLVEHLSTTDPSVQQRLGALVAGFVQKGADLALAKQRALMLLDGQVNAQASVMAFNDTFLVTGLLIVSTLPLILLLGKPAQGVKIDAH